MNPYFIIPLSLLFNSAISCLSRSGNRSPVKQDERHSYEHTLDPEIFMTTMEIIQNRGYIGEEHSVTTEDGYILNIHRVVGKGNEISISNKRPILVVHGIFGSSEDWFINTSNQSMGFVFYDSGYDAWYMNLRGNLHSRRHKTLSNNERKFWQFGIDECGLYDIPATIDYVLSKTGHTQLTLISFSMGTTASFMTLSTKPEYNKKVNIMVSLAPIYKLGHLRGMMKLAIAFFANKRFTEAEYRNPFPMNTEVTTGKPFPEARKAITMEFQKGNTHFIGLMSFFNGLESQVNESRIPIYLSHWPAATSIHLMLHFTQIYYKNSVTMYDWGPSGNWRRYGMHEPPIYNYSRISVATVIFYGPEDFLSTPMEVSELASVLPNLKGVYEVHEKWWGHASFIWAMNVKEKLNDRILDTIKSHD